MHLNPDCIRDILLEIEETTSAHKHFEYRQNKHDEYTRLSKYTNEEILYHIKQCDLSGYLYKTTFFLNLDCIIIDLTPKAHEFLANIRNDNVWNKTKDIAKTVGSVSLDILMEVASNVVMSYVQKLLP